MNQATCRNLRLVIAVRNGDDYGRDKRLSPKGIIQMELLAKALRLMIPARRRIGIFSSDLLRATQSAEIIEKTFGLSHQSSSTFARGRYSAGRDMAEFIIAQGYHIPHVAIVVTHNKAPSGIVDTFAMDLFNKSVPAMVPLGGNGYSIELGKGLVTFDLLNPPKAG